MQIPCPYILSRFLHVTLHHTSKFRSIWYNLIYRGTPQKRKGFTVTMHKVWVIIQIRRQWDLNPRPIAWRSGNLTTTLRSPDLNYYYIFYKLLINFYSKKTKLFLKL